MNGGLRFPGGIAVQGAGPRRDCRVCGGRVKRNGATSEGKTGWRCTACGSSSTRSRPDGARRAQAEAFVAWAYQVPSRNEWPARQHVRLRGDGRLLPSYNKVVQVRDKDRFAKLLNN